MTSPTAIEVEPGSFRDPESRVLRTDDGILRMLSPQGLEDWRRLAASRFYAKAAQEGRIVATELLGPPPLGLPDVLVEGCAGVLRHERIPVVSYPYEWTFGMLRDAALLQLELLAAALAEGMILKDSSPYNVMWRGSRPVFADVGSFEELRQGEPWIGYRQFCMLFLYPLMLQAYKDVPFHPLLRGAIDGIGPLTMRNLMAGERFSKGVMSHVLLHARLESRYEDAEIDASREVKKAGFKPEMIKANVAGLTKLVRRLSWDPKGSEWADYAKTKTYTGDEESEKDAFVAEVAARRHRRLVWDLGANDGRYTRIAAEHADYAVALDADHLTVERLYRRLREEGNEKIHTLVMNAADPSPGLGWRGIERRTLPDRGTPDLTLALALIHHVAISANVPVREFVDWLAGLGGTLVIEFPTREDPMVRRLLTGKRGGLHGDYERDHFERCLHDAFEVRGTQELSSGTRVLYHAEPKGSAAVAAA